MDNNDHLNGVKRVLAWYTKEGDRIVGEHTLPEIGIEQLKVAFRPPDWDPLMYDSYPVGQEAAKFLGAAIGIPLDLDRFDYFVECEVNGPSLEAE